MPILDIQKRARELGRIRTGDKGGKGQPQKLSKFRLTSSSRPLLEKAAVLYGGEVRSWTPAGGVAQFELYTEADRIPIMVPPQPVSQWYETWSAGGCTHRCDGETDYITGEACDPEESALHQQAKPTTRLNVVLRDVEGIGVWRLESHGWNAAVELPQAAEFLAHAGGYVEGWLALEERVSKSIKNGQAQTRKFLVPIIEIGVTPAQLMAGEGRVQTPTLEGPVKATAALEAPAKAPRDYLAEAQEAHTFETVVAIRAAAQRAGDLTEQLDAELKIVADRFRAAAQTPDADGTVDAVVVEGDADAAWNRVLAAAGKAGLNLAATTEEFSSWSGGEIAATASAARLDEFAGYLSSNEQVPA